MATVCKTIKRNDDKFGASPAARARQALDLTLEQAAGRARICPAYLRRLENRGWAGYALALRLSRLYDCSIWHFL